jgi:putative polyhydroxyalkanoate system protein
MADIELSREHQLTDAQARKVAQGVADDMAEEYGLTSEWDGDELHFSRPGVNGRLSLEPGVMSVEVSLGFLLRPFAGKIREHMSANFDKLLADAAKGGKAAKSAKPADAAPAKKAPARKAAAKK